MSFIPRFIEITEDNLPIPPYPPYPPLSPLSLPFKRTVMAFTPCFIEITKDIPKIAFKIIRNSTKSFEHQVNHKRAHQGYKQNLNTCFQKCLKDFRG